jgi:hypothetical protein
MNTFKVGLSAIATAIVGNVALAAEDASHCMELRGFTHNARLLNTCSYDVNLTVCCDGEGNLDSCRGQNYAPYLVESRDSPFVGSCSGTFFWIAFKAPAMPTSELSWSDQSLVYYGASCLSQSQTQTDGNTGSTSAGN